MLKCYVESSVRLWHMIANVSTLSGDILALGHENYPATTATKLIEALRGSICIPPVTALPHCTAEMVPIIGNEAACSRKGLYQTKYISKMAHLGDLGLHHIKGIDVTCPTTQYCSTHQEGAKATNNVEASDPAVADNSR